MFFKGLIFLLIILFYIRPFASVNIAVDDLNSFVFEYNLDQYTVKTDSTSSGIATVIDFAESDKYDTDKNGYRVPYKSFVIGVPQTGNAQIYLEPLETRTVKVTSDLLRAIDTNSVLKHKGQWLTTEDYMSLRDMRVAKFYLTPFNYNSQVKTLNILLKAKITIKYPSGNRATFRGSKKYGDYEQMLSNIVLNYKSAQSFRKASPRSLRSVSPLSTSEKMVSFMVGDGVTGLNETTNKENGIMRITPSDISSILGSSLPISSIAVYRESKRVAS